MKLILASQSPRRRALLERLGLKFTIKTSQLDESAYTAETPEELVKLLSREKALWVARQESPDTLVLGADTVVVLNGQALGKPENPAEAEAMLASLSGRTHTVCTGLTLCRGTEILTEAEQTQVTFRTLRPEEIAAYVRSGEPLDKAGAYGIQGLGSLFVSGIHGDYSNVVGLPLCRLGQMLHHFGIDCLAPWR